MLKKYIELNNKKRMPMVGLGTWQLEDEGVLENSIRSAINAGYRHIDCAMIYGNEKKVGRILQKLFAEGKIRREELFITSKLWNSFHKNPEMGLKKTLGDLQLDYLDLYLIHWPVTFKADDKGIPEGGDQKIIEEYDVISLWQKMERFVDERRVISLGVCNHGRENLSKILLNCRIKPVVNQIEIHPYLNQNELVMFCHENDIQVISYSSLGSTRPSDTKVREDPIIKEIAAKYKKTIPQVILSWLVMKNIIVIPKSTSDNHIRENINLFELDKKDVKKIESLNKNIRYVDIKAWGDGRFK